MSGQPWFKFFPTSWRSDPGLRSCSAAARGLWNDVLCLMHESDPPGMLLVNGRQVTNTLMATLFAMAEREVAKSLAELEAAGVFSRNEQGIVFSRKMVRDAARAARSKANGKSGGNPQLRPDNPAAAQSGITPGLTQGREGLGYPYYPLPLSSPRKRTDLSCSTGEDAASVSDDDAPFGHGGRH